VRERLAGPPATQVLDEHVDRCLLPADPIAGHVRRDDHLLHRPERVLRRERLQCEYIERGTGEVAR
jgi:hypothetical protein